MKKIRINMVSESDVSVQGHGVHTAYEEMAGALEKRNDVELTRGQFGKTLDVDVVHLHTFGGRTWRKLRQKDAKKVISAHVVPASLVGSIVLAEYWLPLARRYMRWYYNKGDKVLAVSDTVANTLHNELGVPRNKIETFYNTIDMSQYAFTDKQRTDARKKLGIKKDEFVVLGIGQVQPRKRLDVFVKMAKELPNVTFVWVGGIPFKQLGADYQAMQKLMNSVPKNLKLPGIIPHDQVRDYLAAASIFCLPAEQENHPMCVLEAAGASLPIILRDIPEYDDTFKQDAIRCKDGEFTDAVRKLQKPAEYKKWQEKAGKIANRFDSTAAAERLVRLYKQLV